MAFFCNICGEESTRICVRCTKDACANHLCERCHRCSDCCECEVALDAPLPGFVRHEIAIPAEYAAGEPEVFPDPDPEDAPDVILHPDPDPAPEPEVTPRKDPWPDPEVSPDPEPQPEVSPDPGTSRTSAPDA